MSRIEGYGGRGRIIQDDLSVIAGLEFTGVKELLPIARCANKKCRRPFRPRAEGDNYHSESCDLATNPRFKAGRSKARLTDDEDPSWQNNVKRIENAGSRRAN